ncbi:MAG TPA: hypothetical protein VF761_17255 [Gemmatimonadaceae bacterium]
MDIRNAIVTTPGRTRIVHPLSDPKKVHPRFLDPEFFVEVKEESNTATARRWDLFKFNPNNLKDKRYAEKQMKVAEQSVQDLVVNFGGLFNAGEPIACNPEGRALLTRASVECFVQDEDEDETVKTAVGKVGDDEPEDEREEALDLEERETEWKSLWVLTQEAIADQKKEEAGNSTRS